MSFGVRGGEAGTEIGTALASAASRRDKLLIYLDNHGLARNLSRMHTLHQNEGTDSITERVQVLLVWVDSIPRRMTWQLPSAIGSAASREGSEAPSSSACSTRPTQSVRVEKAKRRLAVDLVDSCVDELHRSTVARYEIVFEARRPSRYMRIHPDAVLATRRAGDEAFCRCAGEL